MTDQELRKLKRTELLELLLTQEKENEELRRQLQEARDRLAERKLSLDEAGSIAEAAMRLNGVFEAAQAAADQYLENVRSLSEGQESRCARLEAESRQEADRLLRETEERCTAMLEGAKKESQAYWENVSARLEEYYNAHEGLRELLAIGAKRAAE